MNSADTAKRGTSLSNKHNDSPITQLVTELIVLIFEYGHAGYLTSFSHLVSSVCRYWRIVALDIPSLWSPIIISEDENTHRLDLAHLYLNRTKSFPVKLVIVSYADEFMESIMEDLIIPHLDHCRSLTIEGAGQRLLAHILHLGSVPTPILEILEFITEWPAPVENTVLEAWSRRPRRVLFDTPSLRVLSVDMMPFDWTEPALLFHLENVTNFTFKWNALEPNYGRTFHNQINHVVEAMPRLRALTLYCTELAALSPPLLLHNLPLTLQSLELVDIPVAWDLKRAELLSCPFLTLGTLWIAFSSSENFVDIEFLTLLSLAPRLKELHVGTVNLLPTRLEIISPIRLPDLIRLTLAYCGQHTVRTFMDNLIAPALLIGIFTVPRHSKDAIQLNLPDPVVPKFWLSCHQLERIVISHGCTLARNIDLLAALRMLEHVKSLDLRGQSSWDDELLKAMGTPPWPCPSLEEISFSYMTSLTQEILEYFVTARLRGFKAGQCAALKAVKMRGCSNLKNTATLEGIVADVRHWI